MIVITKVLNPTDNLGVRIKAYTNSGQTISAWANSLDVLENHKLAATKTWRLTHKGGTPEITFIGQMPRNDGGYVVIFA